MSPDRVNTGQERIEVYYLKGFVDANIDCSRELDADNAESLEEIKIKSADYERIVRYLNEANYKPEESYTCDMFMQSNFNGPDTVRRRLCINIFNCTTLDNKQVVVNDSLIYLLRNYSGYYNYFEREDLDIFDELKVLGVPRGYKDLSEFDKASNKIFARIIIRPDR